jgi:adenosine deaminase CECR1
MYIDRTIENIGFYKLIKEMPKGILLHAHFPAVVNMIKFIKFLHEKHNEEFKNIYYVSDKDKIRNYSNILDKIKKEITEKLQSLNSLNSLGDNSEEIKENTLNLEILNNSNDFNIPYKLIDDFIYGLSYFPEGPPCEGWTKLSTKSNQELRSIVRKGTRMQNTTEYTWNNLEKYTSNYWSLIKNEKIFDKYFNFLLDEAIDDKLIGIELKTNIGGFHNKIKHTTNFYTNEAGETYPFYTGSWNPDNKELKILESIITERSKEIYCSLILGVPRKLKDDTTDQFETDLTKKCNYYDKLKNDKKLQQVITGIDIFGEEDIKENNIAVIDILKNECHLNYTLHSGETHVSNKIDSNLVSILELANSGKIVRVGHGLSLVNNENLMKLYKDLNIHIELCPLSNYILGYVKNIEEHPGKKLFENNISVSINSDDPSIYNYDYVTYDWVFIIALWKLDLDNIKKLIINSIEFSSASKQKKIEMKEDTDSKFKKWCSTYQNSFLNLREQAYQYLQIFNSSNSFKGGYYEKYLKYKNKYLSLKKDIYMQGESDNSRFNNKYILKNKKCTPTISSEREKSNCDRIIYKVGSNIKFLEYDVVTEKEFDLVKYSDHKMIHSKFEYNNEQYMIYSWNMNVFDKKFNNEYKDILNMSIMKYFTKKHVGSKYLIFTFQESLKNSLFIKLLIEELKSLNFYLINHTIFDPLFASEYCVQILLFSTDKNTKIIESGNKKFNITNSITNRFKSFIGTKSFVYININNLMIIGSHFPINTKKEDLGNNLRIMAFNQINEYFGKYNNLIIAGDLNFRNLNNIDQLDTLLKNNKNFIEPGKLKQPTCKYNECKIKCDHETCKLELKTQNGGDPKFPISGVSGKRVIINRSRIAKIISSNIKDGNYIYKIEYTDTEPRTQEDNILEKNIMNFPSNIHALNPDKYILLKPGQYVKYMFGSTERKGYILSIRNSESELYAITTKKQIYTFIDAETSNIPRENIKEVIG